MIERIEKVFSEVTGTSDLNFTSKTKLDKIPGLSSLGIIQIICGLEDEFDIDIPNSVTKIGSYVFFGCQSIKQLTIPNNVKTIESYSIYNMSSLEQLKLGKSFEYDFNDNPFDKLPSLQRIEIDSSNSYFTTQNGILYDKNIQTLILYPTNYTSKNYTIPKTISSMKTFAFNSKTNLQDITIQSKETKYFEVFKNLLNLKVIRVGKECEQIDVTIPLMSLTAFDVDNTGFSSTLSP